MELECARLNEFDPAGWLEQTETGGVLYSIDIHISMQSGATGLVSYIPYGILLVMFLGERHSNLAFAWLHTSVACEIGRADFGCTIVADTVLSFLDFKWRQGFAAPLRCGLGQYTWDLMIPSWAEKGVRGRLCCF